MRDLLAIALGLAWSLLRPRRARQHPYDCIPAARGPHTYQSGPLVDPLTIEDVHAPAAPTWGVQRGAC